MGLKYLHCTEMYGPPKKISCYLTFTFIEVIFFLHTYGGAHHLLTVLQYGSCVVKALILTLEQVLPLAA